MALKDPAILDHTLTPLERAALGRFVRDVRELLGERLDEIVLFGSKARGDPHEESDIDVLILTRDEPTFDDKDRVVSLAVERQIETRSFLFIAPVVMSRADFNGLLARERIFPLDVVREGIRL